MYYYVEYKIDKLAINVLSFIVNLLCNYRT